jgi:hypothetical protein
MGLLNNPYPFMVGLEMSPKKVVHGFGDVCGVLRMLMTEFV